MPSTDVRATLACVSAGPVAAAKVAAVAGTVPFFRRCAKRALWFDFECDAEGGFGAQTVSPVWVGRRSLL